MHFSQGSILNKKYTMLKSFQIYNPYSAFGLSKISPPTTIQYVNNKYLE